LPSSNAKSLLKKGDLEANMRQMSSKVLSMDAFCSFLSFSINQLNQKEIKQHNQSVSQRKKPAFHGNKLFPRQETQLSSCKTNTLEEPNDHLKQKTQQNELTPLVTPKQN